jgi:glucose-1-phosphate cytidylyltransferase
MRSGAPGDLPKPMQLVGPRPLLWHVMRYYAHFGHTEFVLCLGYGAHHIKEFFLNYQESASNDFVLRDGKVELLSTDISGWSISFVQTGINSPIGERLRRVRHHLDGEEMFLANYADVLTDAPLPEIIDRFAAADAGASMMIVPPPATFHCIELGAGTMVSGITPVSEMPLWANGGYFVLRQEVFDHIPENGDLVADGCAELAKRGRLLAYPHRGYWRPTDTIKERAALDEAYSRGDKPWALWERRRPARIA